MFSSQEIGLSLALWQMIFEALQSSGQAFQIEVSINLLKNPKIPGIQNKNAPKNLRVDTCETYHRTVFIVTGRSSHVPVRKPWFYFGQLCPVYT